MVIVYNKIDVVSIEDVDRLARMPHSVVIACEHQGRPAVNFENYIWLFQTTHKTKNAPNNYIY
jgi:hypothetical protein